MAVVRALFSANITPTLVINAGELWDADDPVVRQHPEWFSDDLDAIARRTRPAPVMEEATAEPGVRRATRKSA